MKVKSGALPDESKVLAGQSCGFAQIWAAEHRRPTAFGFHEPAVRSIRGFELLVDRERRFSQFRSRRFVYQRI
jgi:hypothetical protein